MTDAEKRANAAKKQLQALLAGREGFAGTGIGASEQGELHLVVYVTGADSPVLEVVPVQQAGFPVRTVVTGRPEAR